MKQFCSGARVSLAIVNEFFELQLDILSSVVCDVYISICTFVSHTFLTEDLVDKKIGVHCCCFLFEPGKGKRIVKPLFGKN